VYALEFSNHSREVMNQEIMVWQQWPMAWIHPDKLKNILSPCQSEHGKDAWRTANYLLNTSDGRFDFDEWEGWHHSFNCIAMT
jgi:hypothetical protein